MAGAQFAVKTAGAAIKSGRHGGKRKAATGSQFCGGDDYRRNQVLTEAEWGFHTGPSGLPRGCFSSARALGVRTLASSEVVYSCQGQERTETGTRTFWVEEYAPLQHRARDGAD